MHPIPAPSAAPPDPPGTPDLERDVHYALRAESLTWHTAAAKPVSLCQPIYSALRMIVIPGVFILCFVLASVVPGPTFVRFGIVALVIATAIALIVRRARREKLDSSRITTAFPEMSNQRSRLRVAGPAVQLERLRSLLAEEREEFEPRIFRVGRARSRGVRDSLFFGAIFLTALAAILLPAYGHLRVPMMGMVVVYTAVTISVLAWAFLWPAYLRFVPGRLDILQYGLLGRGKPQVRSIDLTAVRVLINIPGSAVIFFPGESPVGILDVGPSPPNSGADPLAFELAMLASAKCTSPSPILPDDELIG